MKIVIAGITQIF